MSMKRKKLVVIGHFYLISKQSWSKNIVGHFFPRRPPPKRNCPGTSLVLTKSRPRFFPIKTCLAPSKSSQKLNSKKS